MLRTLFFLLLLVHGLIHLLGWLKAYQLATIPALTVPIGRLAGAAWLVSALLLVAAAALYAFRQQGWWMLAAPALLLSQFLLIQSWADARYGTLANVLILAMALIAWGQWRFAGLVRHDQQTLWAAAPPSSPPPITPQQVASLPAPVQRWLSSAGALGTPPPYLVRIRQTGEMKTSPTGKWIPFSARQHFSPLRPGFVWHTQIAAAPGVFLAGRDRFYQGQGHMLIKLLWLAPVADATGPATDQGTLLRYLAEICWFPQAALQPYLRWEGIDDHTARAIITSHGRTDSALFHFNAAGDLLRVEARRYYDRPSGPTLEPWTVTCTSHATFSGIRAPNRCTVTWDLADGPFTWLKLEITELEYNEAARRE